MKKYHYQEVVKLCALAFRAGEAFATGSHSTFEQTNLNEIEWIKLNVKEQDDKEVCNIITMQLRWIKSFDGYTLQQKYVNSADEEVWKDIEIVTNV